MNNLQHHLPTHFGATEVTPVGSGNHPLSYGSAASIQVYYFNYLPTPVTVGWRSGLKVTFPPQPNLTENRLIVRVKLDFAPAVKVDILRVLSVVDFCITPELKAMREVLLAQLANQGNNYGGSSFVLDYPITAEELRAYGGTVYYNDLDCIISTAAFDQVPPHPHSVVGRREQLVQTQTEKLASVGFGYSIDLVDNLGRYGDRFINIGGKVYKIRAARDTSRQDGVYVVANAAVTSSSDDTQPEMKFYTFEGAEQTLGIFRSAEEAAALGDMSTARKRELAEMEHELQIGKKTLQEIEQKHALVLAEQTREIERLKAKAAEDKIEFDRIVARDELERQRIKDYYDSRAYSRKDNSEALKMLPAVIVGVGALVVAFKAWT